jgi:hypothetical protein
MDCSGGEQVPHPVSRRLGSKLARRPATEAPGNGILHNFHAFQRIPESVEIGIDHISSSSCWWLAELISRTSQSPQHSRLSGAPTAEADETIK